jgi:hypothetical protein
MIAPIRQETSPRKTRGQKLHKAHHFVAATLLTGEPQPGRTAPQVPAWQAWAFVVWLGVVSACYVAHMLGWL